MQITKSQRGLPSIKVSSHEENLLVCCSRGDLKLAHRLRTQSIIHPAFISDSWHFLEGTLLGWKGLTKD